MLDADFPVVLGQKVTVLLAVDMFVTVEVEIMVESDDMDAIEEVVGTAASETRDGTLFAAAHWARFMVLGQQKVSPVGS